MTFQTIFEKKIQEIDNKLPAYLPPAGEGTLQEAMSYSLMAGGKRLRPLFMMETFHLLGGKGDGVWPFMAALEMIHTFSLVHDDLPCMDNDLYRRGKKTTWAAYGEAMGVLSGDGLFMQAFTLPALAAKEGIDPEKIVQATAILAEKAGVNGMLGGQALDVEKTGQALSKEQLSYIYEKKTGALLEAAMMTGAVLAPGGTVKNIEKVECIARRVGLAFQIRDDILDCISTEAVLGKPIHSDEKNQKTTYVSLYGMEQAKQQVKQLSEEALSLLGELPGDVQFLEQLIEMLITREK